METRKRTIRQNSALHLYLEHLSEALNGAGLDMRKTLRADIDIPWTMESAKEWLWKPVQRALYGKSSTTELTTTDITKIYDTLNRHLSQKFGVSVDFPSEEELIFRSKLEDKQ
jgi:hypothetical protein